MTAGGALTERDCRIMTGCGFAAAALFYLGVLHPWNLTDSFMVGAPVGRDFVNFWLGGHLALQRNLDLLVDLQGYNDLIVRTFGHHAADEFVFSYPPHALLLLLPFGAMPFGAAIAIWTALNLFCIYRAGELMAPRRDLALVACLSPAVLMMVVYGHFGGLLALLATVILVQGGQRAVLAGLCLALMSVKPQLALLFGVFLLLIGQWRIIAWSIAWTLALVAASLITFGWQPWTNFIEWTVPHHAGLLSDFVVNQLKSTISPYAGARMAGLPDWTAQAVQWGFSAVALAAAVIVYRRRGPEPRSIALALMTVVIALPYANSYDLAMAAPALALALFADSPVDERPLLPFVPAFLLWTMPVVSPFFGAASWPVVPLALAVLLLMALAREIPRRSGWFGDLLAGRRIRAER
jgi:hypothetical protein